MQVRSSLCIYFVLLAKQSESFPVYILYREYSSGNTITCKTQIMLVNYTFKGIDNV